MDGLDIGERVWSPLRSRRGGVLKSAIFLGLFLVAAFALLWMLALPWAFEMKLERDTGCSWTAERLASNPFGFEIRIEEATLGNSEAFDSGRPMMKIRSFRAEVVLQSLISDVIVVERAELDISRLAIVVNESGVLNLEQFARDLFGESKGLGKGIRFVDCSLKIDTVEILDYSSVKPSHKALQLAVNVDGFTGEGAISIFEPVLEIARRAEYLPDPSTRIDSSAVSASLQ